MLIENYETWQSVLSAGVFSVIGGRREVVHPAVWTLVRFDEMVSVVVECEDHRCVAFFHTFLTILHKLGPSKTRQKFTRGFFVHVSHVIDLKPENLMSINQRFASFFCSYTPLQKIRNSRTPYE